MNTKRYAIVGEWEEVDRVVLTSPYDTKPNPAFIIERAGLLEKASGRVYPFGAARVRVIGKAPGFRSKTFLGDKVGHALVYAEDAAHAERRTR